MSERVEALTIRLLGPFDVWRNGARIPMQEFGRRKARNLLAILLSEPGQVFPYDRLVDFLQLGASDPVRARRNLHSLTSGLRRVLEPDRPRGRPSTFISRVGEGYRFNDDGPYWVDVRAFRQQVARVEDLVTAERWGEAYEECRTAVGLYRGDFAPDEQYAEWALAPREQLRSLHLTALGWLAECQARCGRLSQAIGTCDDLIARQPWSETAYRQKMYYQYCCGEVGAAEETFRVCAKRLSEHLDVTPSDKTCELHAHIRRHEAPRLERWTPCNLPRPMTSFVGRAQEKQRVSEMLRLCRLVTLTGFGGIGKTRLAIEVGFESLHDFDDGVLLVELSGTHTENDVPAAVCRTLGVDTKDGQHPTEAIAEYVRARRMLLIIDTCEHVIRAVARLAKKLIHSSTALRILATSREALGISGEMEVKIAGMSTPSEEASTEEIASSEAVRLFLERLASAGSLLPLQADSAQWIGRLCRRLGGLPLAIELAASAAERMPLGEIPNRLDDPIRLAANTRIVPDRHRTMAAVIDWSYDLLSADEQAVFRRLSTFAGGCTAEAAVAVVSGNGVKPTRVPSLLRALAGKSLAVFEADTGRFRLLDVLCDYAAGRLHEDPGEDAVWRRHYDFFFRLVLRADLQGPARKPWIRHLESELDNLYAALERCIASGRVTEGLRLAAALGDFWQVSRRGEEGLAWYQQLLGKREGLRSKAVVDGLTQAARLLYTLGRRHEALPLAQEAVAMGRELEGLRALSTAQVLLGLLLADLGDVEGSRRSLEEGLALSRQSGFPYGILFGLTYLGRLARQGGDVPAARKHLEEAIALSRDVGYRRSEAQLQGEMAVCHEEAGQYQLAREGHETALRIAQEIGEVDLEVWFHIELGTMGLGVQQELRADPSTCRAHVEQAVQLARQVGDANDQFLAFLNQAILRLALGDPKGAMRSLSGALPLSREGRCRYSSALLAPVLARALSARGEPRKAMHVIGAATEALAACSDLGKTHFYMRTETIEGPLRRELGKAASDRLRTEGRRMDLNEILDGILLQEGPHSR